MLHKLNPRALPVTVKYGEKSITETSSDKGETTLFLELSGNERFSLEAQLIIDNKIVGKTTIPIKKPIKTFVLGEC